MLGCRAVREVVSDESDGQLSRWYAAYVRLHTALCPPCRRVKRSFDRTVEVLRELREETEKPEEDEASRP